MLINLLKFALLVTAAALASGCDGTRSGPVRVSAIGGPPQVANPNLTLLDPPSAFLVEAVAQGLVRFNARGEIEPALAQSWILSDDGLRFTFRLRRTGWTGSGRLTAEQVATRLRAAISGASRNRLKPVLGAVAEVAAMTDQVLEITLAGPRPHFLQLLAQPEMAVARAGRGTGPYRAEPQPETGAIRLISVEDEPEVGGTPLPPEILLRGEAATRAVARFALDEADLVTGGTLGSLPFARAADLPATRLVFDPVEGLFGLAFLRVEGPLAEPEVRAALSMAVDRAALAASAGGAGFRPRDTLLPGMRGEFAPAIPDWSSAPVADRRVRAAGIIAAAGSLPILRVALPEGPGYRLAFAQLRRDWRLIGVEARAVAANQPAELRLVDAVAPSALPSWYLRHFTCATSALCAAVADEALDRARSAAVPAERRAAFEEADRILSGMTVFIPLATPLRWSLVAPRLTGFRANASGRHPAATLIAEER